MKPLSPPLSDAISAQVYLSPAAFMPVLTKVLANVTADKKLLEKIADGLFRYG